MESKIDYKEMLSSMMLELSSKYDQLRGKTFKNTIAVPGVMTTPIADDIQEIFFDRGWYTGKYVENLSDDAQDGLDNMLDAFDKLHGEVLFTDDCINLPFDFLLNSDDLLNAYCHLLNDTVESFQEKYPMLTVAAITEEVGHLEVIETTLKNTIEKGK